MPMKRRTFLKATPLSVPLISGCSTFTNSLFHNKKLHKMAFELPALPYAVAALEPHIDAKTMEIHHGKHHAAYVTNLNNAVAADASAAGKTLEELVGSISKYAPAIRNNGGGHWNHSFFWQILAPKAGGEPTGEIAYAIKGAFGSYENFKKEFSAAAMTQIGRASCRERVCT